MIFRTRSVMHSFCPSAFGSFSRISVGLLTAIVPLTGSSGDPKILLRRIRTRCWRSPQHARTRALPLESVSGAGKSLYKGSPWSARFRETPPLPRSTTCGQTVRALPSPQIRRGPRGSQSSPLPGPRCPIRALPRCNYVHGHTGCCICHRRVGFPRRSAGRCATGATPKTGSAVPGRFSGRRSRALRSVPVAFREQLRRLIQPHLIQTPLADFWLQQVPNDPRDIFAGGDLALQFLHFVVQESVIHTLGDFPVQNL